MAKGMKERRARAAARQAAQLAPSPRSARPLEVFYIAADADDARLEEAMFDGPGWYWWGGRCPEGCVEGPYRTQEEAARASTAPA